MLNIMGLKSRNMISLLLDIPDVRVSGVHMNEHGDYIITVESLQSGTICQHCGRKITKFHGHGRWIELRHLSILGCRVYIHLQPKQYKCPHCDDKMTTQRLDWYETKSPHTKAYDHHLMLQLIGSTVEDVSRKENVGYDAVEGAWPMNPFTEGDRVIVTTIDDGATRHGTARDVNGDGLLMDCDDGEAVTSPYWFVEAEPKMKNEGLLDFLETLRYWLSTFPRVYVCENCGRKVWLIGRSGAPVFCGRECFESEHDVEF